jgi:hypothetical protein
MDLQGNLSVFPAPSLFQMLKMALVTGELRVEAAHNGAALYFEEGEITFARLDLPRPEKLGSYLVRQKYITSEDLDRALEDYHEDGDDRRRLGSYLVENGALTQETLAAVIQGRMVEVIYQVLSWNKGSFSFHSGIKAEEEDILLDVALDHLVLEGLKRLDETTRVG